jgi:hypothetical protein
VNRRHVFILGIVAVMVTFDVILGLRILGSNGAQDAADDRAGGSAASTAEPDIATSKAGASTAPTSSPEAPTNTTDIQVAPRITLRATDETVATLELVTLTGSYPGAPPGTELRVQRRDDGAWVDFPLPTVVHRSGRYIARVQLGGVGRYRLRVVAPLTGGRSNVVAIRVE